MPVNKLAALRHRIIDRLLVEKKLVTKSDMLEACEEALDLQNLAERTIDQDIYDMRYDNQLGFYAPIVYNRSSRVYYYEDPNYSIDRIPLNREELKSLAFVASLLEQFKKVDIFETYRDAVEKIVTGINIRRMQQDLPKFDFIGFEKSPLEKGIEFLSILIGAIASKKVVDVEYHRFDSTYTLTHSIHPYYLKEYRNRWYLIGYLDRVSDIGTFALDRMIDVKINDMVVYRDSDFNPEEYFRDSIGVIARMNKPEMVKLKFSHFQGNYLLTQPIHPSQVVYKETRDHFYIRLKVSITYELISTILGWGKDVTVLSPAALREEIKMQLAAMNQSYEL